MRRLSFFLILFIFLGSCSQGPAVTYATPAQADPRQTSTPSSGPDAQDYPASFAMTKALGRGINLGDALEAPREGAWGITLTEQDFVLIKQAGFTSVRLPINWDAHAGSAAPFTIAPTFFARVSKVVNWALNQQLLVILDFHGYPKLMADPQASQARYLGLWKQIAGYYKGYPTALLFELLNEPGGALDATQWNALSAQTLTLVRQTNPNRNVIIGGANMNAYDQVQSLSLPSKDRHIIVSFHYYNPFNFTHQGADWVPNMAQYLGSTWEGTDAQKSEITSQFDKVAAWAAAQNRPVLLGEFGAYSKAPMDSRVSWTAFVARQAEKRGFAWSYWEFSSKFGAYDPAAKAWRAPLLQALIP